MDALITATNMILSISRRTMRDREILWTSRKSSYYCSRRVCTDHDFSRHHSLTLLLDGKLTLAPVKDGPMVSANMTLVGLILISLRKCLMWALVVVSDMHLYNLPSN